MSAFPYWGVTTVGGLGFLVRTAGPTSMPNKCCFRPTEDRFEVEGGMPSPLRRDSSDSGIRELHTRDDTNRTRNFLAGAIRTRAIFAESPVGVLLVLFKRTGSACLDSTSKGDVGGVC